MSKHRTPIFLAVLWLVVLVVMGAPKVKPSTLSTTNNALLAATITKASKVVTTKSKSARSPPVPSVDISDVLINEPNPILEEPDYYLLLENCALRTNNETLSYLVDLNMVVVGPNLPLPNCSLIYTQQQLTYMNATGNQEGLITRIEIMRLKQLHASTSGGGDILETVDYIGEYFNPAVVPWADRLFLSSRLVVDTRMKRHFAENHIEFAWLNHSTAPFYSHAPYYGISSNSLMSADRELPGQDARIIVVSESRLLLSFTVSMVTKGISGKYMRTGKAELYLNENQITVAYNRSIIPIRYTKKNRHEKNWVPFLYRKQPHFISTICPTLVVKPGRVIDKDPYSGADIGERQYAKFVSNRTCGKMSWSYGQLRGGTNAILLGDRYLAIFHSLHTLEGSKKRTYFMGAFTFSSLPPFTLLQISRYPIVDYALYDGETFSRWRRKSPNNYVVFPMSLYQQLNGDIMISLGTQDRRGWLCKINYRALSMNMEEIKSIRICEDGKANDNCDPAELNLEEVSKKKNRVKSQIEVVYR